MRKRNWKAKPWNKMSNAYRKNLEFGKIQGCKNSVFIHVSLKIYIAVQVTWNSKWYARKILYFPICNNSTLTYITNLRFSWLLWNNCKIWILQIRKTWFMDETVNCTIEHVQVQSSFLSGVKEHTTLEGKDKQISVIFEDSLVYTVSFRKARSMSRDPVS